MIALSKTGKALQCRIHCGLLFSFVLPIAFCCWCGAGGKADQQAEVITIHVDALQDRHAISPLIYGVNFATPEQLKLLNSPIDRSGGNATTRYNWKQNCTSSGNDWFFMSHPEDG